MTTSKPHWLQLLEKSAKATSIGKTAEVVGYSRTSVSQALAGKYPGDLAKMEQKVLQALELPMAVDCPHLKLKLPTSMCNQFSAVPAPIHNPVSIQIWRACQTCANRCDPPVQRRSEGKR